MKNDDWLLSTAFLIKHNRQFISKLYYQLPIPLLLFVILKRQSLCVMLGHENSHCVTDVHKSSNCSLTSYANNKTILGRTPGLVVIAGD